MKLSDNDAKIFFEALENPPEPSDRLKQAMKEYLKFKEEAIAKKAIDDYVKSLKKDNEQDR